MHIYMFALKIKMNFYTNVSPNLLFTDAASF